VLQEVDEATYGSSTVATELKQYASAYRLTRISQAVRLSGSRTRECYPEDCNFVAHDHSSTYERITQCLFIIDTYPLRDVRVFVVEQVG
jgi:hypothetical protein